MNTSGRWIAGLSVVICAALVVAWLAQQGRLSNGDSLGLLSQPIPDAFDDRLPGDFLGAQLDSQTANGLAVVKTLAGAIVYRNLLAENPEIATRLPANNVALDGGVLVTSVSYPQDAWSDANFVLEHDIESELRLYEMDSDGEVALNATREVPGQTDDLSVQNSRMYRKYHVDRVESADGEVYSDVRLSVYDISDPEALAVVVENVELGEVSVLPPMSVSHGPDEVAAFVISNEVNATSNILVVDAGESGSVTETVAVGFEVLAVGGSSDRRFALVGEHEIAVVDEVSPGHFDVVSSLGMTDTLSFLVDVDGAVAFIVADSSGTATGESDVLIAIDLEGVSGPTELWRDDFEVPFDLTRSIAVDGDKLAVVSHNGVSVYALSGGEIELMTSRKRTAMQFAGVASYAQGVLIADRLSGIKVYEHGPGGELVYVETIDVPAGFEPTRGIEVVDDVLYVITSGVDSANELVAISLDGGNSEIVARVAIKGLINEWNRTTHSILAGFQNWLLVGMNDRVMLMDVAQPDEPELLGSIQVDGHVRSLDVGVGTDSHPLACYSFDLLVECVSLDAGSLLESVGEIDFTMGAGHIRVRNGYIYAAGPMGGVSIATVSEAGIVEVSHAQPGYVHITEAIEVVGDIALVGSVSGVGIQVFDVSNPAQIEFLGYGDWLPFVKLMVSDGANRVYISSETDVKALDWSDPEDPVVIGTLLGSG